jgi:hypothetical protein
MNKPLLKKIVAVASIITLFLNLIFVALRVYSHTVFWVLIGTIAIISLSIMKLVK